MFLDQCRECRDVKAALRIANMSITFHTKTPWDQHSAPPNSSPKNDVKHYLQREPDIVHNLIWKSDQFWEDSLSIGLSEQLEMMERVRWDELEADVLKERIIAIHNMIFGQLGTIAFTMHEMGLPRKHVCLPLIPYLINAEKVEKFVMARSQGAQLGRDQQIELLKSIR